MGEYTEKELVAIKEFRNRISDIIPNEFSNRDDSLIRWIRAREMNLDKAEEMIRHSMTWRKDNNVDEVLNNGIDFDLSEKFPYYVDGVDKSGRPVVSMPFGAWDLRSLMEAEGPTRLLQYITQMLETLAGAIKQSTYQREKESGDHENENAKKGCVQFVVISDMVGYSFRQLANMKAVQSIIQMISMYEAHYPESMAECIVINAPSIFSILFGMMKPFMSSRTVGKIKVFTSDKTQWEPVILEMIDAHEIREQYGGTKI